MNATNRNEVRQAKREAALLATRAQSLANRTKRNSLTGPSIRFVR